MPKRSCVDHDGLACTTLKGVGPRLSECLARLGIVTLRDLLFHLPRQYQDRTRLIPLNRLRPGQQALTEGEVELVDVSYGHRRQLICRLSDDSGFLTLRFFHFNLMQKRALSRGVHVRCFGEVRFGPNGYEMIHPEYQCVDPNKMTPLEKTLTPIYPTIEKLHQATLRKLIHQVLEQLEKDEESLGLVELLPKEILQQHHFPSLKETILYLHRPPRDVSLDSLIKGDHPYQQRLVFEELLAHHLSLRELREKAQDHAAESLKTNKTLTKRFISQLPFDLTSAQVQVFYEIQADLERSYPMLRLVQGDVGSGKTIVAALAALVAVENEYQAVMMAPTELLAEQHFKNLYGWLEPLGIHVALLSGKRKGREREQTLAEINEGKARIIVGTHALFQEGVTFFRLALVIIDEQHRFGVHQRLALREKGKTAGCYPHQLIMTATPIPRTLAMSAYADLDHSVIDVLPPGRIPVKTVVLSNKKRNGIIERIRLVCHEGKQVYWVCTLIEESDILQCQAAEQVAEQLKQALPELRIALVHGRMRPKEKEERMTLFKRHEIDLLVATTVIEVGVDVPNASLMVIENAERLGLSQLHQLRGRVGRGQKESHCVLMYHSPLGELAKQRLEIMRATSDGFLIAQKDLELRGPGEVLGVNQTGIIFFRIADLLRDKAWLPEVQNIANMISRYYRERASKIIARWMKGSQEYGHV